MAGNIDGRSRRQRFKRSSNLIIKPDQYYKSIPTITPILECDGDVEESENYFLSSYSSNSASSSSPRSSPKNKSSSSYDTAIRIRKLQNTLKNLDDFISTNGIKRPDFFCRYRERQSLQQIVDQFYELNKTRRSRRVQRRLRPESRRSGSRKDVTPNEEAHLEQELKHLRSRLVTLGHQIQVGPRHVVPTNPTSYGPPLGGSGYVNKPLPPDPHPQRPPFPTPVVTNNQSNGYYVNQQFPKEILQTRESDCKASASVIATRTTTSGGTPSESSHTSIETKTAPRLSDVEDLIHIPGALTEDALIRSIQSRCQAGRNYVYMGPILLTINPLSTTSNALTLSSTKDITPQSPLLRIVQEAHRQQADTGYPQAVILSGSSGSGKTYTSMLILRQLFQLEGGGLETDAFRHLSASISVLRSLGTAKTLSNSESSRIGHFIEAQITEGTVYRTRVHCYFLDQSRVVRTSPEERNYHIFYQMLAGLNKEERAKLHLGDHSAETLRYLTSEDNRFDTEEDARRFLEWKSSLALLGIPFLDVVRVLAAVILLGNVEFIQTSHCVEPQVKDPADLASISSLLGVSETALKQGLTTRTHNTRNQLLRSRCDANMSNVTRDSLAKSLYCRTVATIVRRANSVKRLNSNSGTLSSDSTDSVHKSDLASQHASTVGTAGSKASKSMTALNNAVRHATDSFIGILDMFGFEDTRPSQLEHLCVNLCAETMQHFYNTHIFKASIESCHDEGIRCDWELDYVDNVPCIDLISSLKTGLLSMLDVECSLRGTVESYIQKVRTQHKENPRLLETKSTDLRSFAIQHYAGKVYYDATAFPDTNRDVLADDLVAVFHKHRCSFGFANHLFSAELKILGAGGIEPCPKGISFRVSPTSHTELLNGCEPVSTLTQDFHTRLDNLLRTLVHAKPHFVRCIKINNSEQRDLFDRHTVSKQLRAFQVLETVNLMANGYPHRMRFKAFNARYKFLAPWRQLTREDRPDCQVILDGLQNCGGHVSWAIGKRHVFMSEGTRQQLELLRTSARNRAAQLIQSTWRGWYCRQRWCSMRQTRPEMGNNPSTQNQNGLSHAHPPTLQTNSTSLPHLHSPGNNKHQNPPPVAPPIVSKAETARSLPNLPGVAVPPIGHPSNANTNEVPLNGGRPRPQPIAGTPPPEMDCDSKLVQQTCNLFGLDMERPPPLPPSRSYTVTGNTKFGYPQTRLMRMSFPDGGTGSSCEVRLLKGELVLVVGASPRRGHLVVEHKTRTIHVPYQYLELKTTTTTHG